MRINNEDLLIAGPVDMTTSFELPPVYLGHICNYSIQLVFTGAPNGTYTLQCSNDPGNPNVRPLDPERYENVVNWTTITGSAQPILAAGDHTYQVQNAGYPWVRVVWTASSGSGSLTSARSNVKGV